MSGPKISVAELERMRKQEEEHRNLLQSIFRLQSIFVRQEEAARQLEKMLNPISEQDGAGVFSDRLESVQVNIRKIGYNVTYTSKEFARKLEEESNEYLGNVLKRLNGIVRENDELLKQADAVGDVIRRNYIEGVLEQYRSSFVEGVLDKYRVPSSEVFKGNSGDELKSEERESVLEAVKSEADRISAELMLLQPRLRKVKISRADIERIRDHLNVSISDKNRDPEMIYQEIHRIDLFEFRPLRSRVEKLEAEADELDELLSSELAKYHVLCYEAGETPKKFAFRKESLTEIRYECGRIIEQRETEDIDVTLIMQKVRQSLLDLGYEYIGEKCESLKTYREAYRIHDNVVLHVIYDSNGRITMEVAIEDDCDRQPYQREIEMIVGEQESFCKSFERIFEAINQNGLALRKEQMFPCSPDFAEIINTSEFSGSEENSYDLYVDYRDYGHKYLEDDVI